MMNAEISNRLPQFTRTNIVVISLICFILLLLAVGAQITYTILHFDKVYEGVYINDIHVGNLSADELSSLLKSSYEDKAATLEISLTAKDRTEKFTFPDAGVVYNIKDAVDKAYGVGRNGNLLDRLLEIYKIKHEKQVYELLYSFDKQKVEKSVQNLYNKVFVSVKNADLLIQSGKVTIKSGHHGESIDKEKALAEIDSYIKACKGGSISIPILYTPAAKINVDDFFNQINLESKDATPKVENNNVTILPEVTGRSIEKSALAAIAEELEKAEDTAKTLPVTFIKPNVTTEDVKKQLFDTTLGSMNTQFYTYTQNDANRGENIRLAISKINGKILGPGEIFSFNGVVGPRTVEGGYKVAHVYSDGKIIDDIGGGICQVSTTLYNAVLFSDLDIVERTNHMFTVGYVPLGRDAAVSYGDVDFKFKNSSRWPIKIESWVTSDNRLFFAVKGTGEMPGKTVEINSAPTKTLNFDTKYIDDPLLAQGEYIVSSEGITGYIVDTYKVVKRDGIVVSETKLHTSIYNPLSKEVRRGTKKS